MTLAIRSVQCRDRETQWPIEFIISQQMIKLLLESPLNIWDRTLARSLPRARCASLASISRIGASPKGKRILPSVEAPFVRSFLPTERGCLAARELPGEIFLARTSRTLSARLPFSTLSSAAAPSARSNVPFSRLSAGTRPVSRPVINKSIALLSHRRRAPLAALS